MKPPFRAWGTAALFVLLTAIFLVERARGAVGSDPGLLALGALPDRGGLDGQYWRLLTFGLLHSNLAHLLLNGLILLLAGPAVERRAGALWLPLMFLAASIASGAGIMVKHQLWPADSVSVGASGGMFGLLGAALVLVLREGREGVLGRAVLGFALAAGLAYSLLPGVSLLGHLVGLAVGAALALLIGSPAGTAGPLDGAGDSVSRDPGRSTEAPAHHLGRPIRVGLLLLGIGLVAAALWLGYALFINVVVGLFEPVHLTGIETAFVAAELLLPFLVLAAGIAALACTKRARLRGLGICAVVAAADLALACALYGPAMADWCAGYQPVAGSDTSECARGR